MTQIALGLATVIMPVQGSRMVMIRIAVSLLPKWIATLRNVFGPTLTTIDALGSLLLEPLE
jgi:hypothetical protein